MMLAAVAVLSACEDPERYPLSGQECGPEDPVKNIDGSLSNCLPPSA